MYVNPATEGTLYFNPACKELTDTGPDTAPISPGVIFSVFVCATLLPQVLLATTESVPPLKFVIVLKVILAWSPFVEAI